MLLRISLLLVLIANILWAGLTLGVALDGDGNFGVVCFFGSIQIAIAIACLGGLHTSIASSVPVNSHASFETPEAAPTASRIGRSTNHALITKKKYTNDVTTARTSSA